MGELSKIFLDGIQEDPNFLDKYIEEQLFQEKFWERWAEKVNNLSKEKRLEAIKKCKEQYESDLYRESEYRKGYEPRQLLYDLLFEYARKYSVNIYKEKEERGDCLDFCSGLYLIDDTYILGLYCGQGSFIDVYTIPEWEERQKFLKSKNI